MALHPDKVAGVQAVLVPQSAPRKEVGSTLIQNLAAHLHAQQRGQV